MADPIKSVRSLAAISTDYTVFEPDQVLSHDQLNGIVSYLDDQQRLTRIDLIGVGIAGGLRVSLAGSKVSISRGVGVSSDGDRLALAADMVFDRFKPYGDDAPVYSPFYNGESRMKLYELVPAKGATLALASGRPSAATLTDTARPSASGIQPLTAFPAKLADMVVLAYMESYEQDPDLCTGADCDNLGKTARNTQRFLLVSQADAKALMATLATTRDAAAALAELEADRPALSKSIATQSAFNTCYRSSCDKIRSDLKTRLPTLYPALGQLTNGLFVKNPGDAWVARLDAIDQAVAAAGESGIQYYHAFLKDLVETWNDLREVLFSDHALLCPPAGAFPKHLLLGALAAPDSFRTGCFPAPWHAGTAWDHARCLVQKLDALIHTFQLPTDAKLAIRITPSRGETAPLEERAIPFYYPPVAKKPLTPYWNYRLGSRGDGGRNPGYYAATYGGTSTPFKTSIGRHDFFRIEGHLGKDVDAAVKSIEALLQQHNLPIAVASVLIHSDRKKVRPPKFKYTPLHSFNYLLRNDLASHLQDSASFSSALLADVTDAKSTLPSAQAGILGNVQIKLVQDTATQVQQTAQSLIGSASAAGPLTQTSYKTYSTQALQWKAPLELAVGAASRVKSSLGNVLRTDVTSPFDAIQASKTHLWVDWLDTLILNQDEVRKDRLLFSNMLKQYPGLEHGGGVPRGGTFVLAYNDAGTVIGDFMLSCWIDDVDESEREEPGLTLPPIRLPVDVPPIKVIKPIEWVLDDFKVNQILPDIKIQQDYMKFFQESLGSLGSIVNPGLAVTNPGYGIASGDVILDGMLGEVMFKKDQILKMKTLLATNTLPKSTIDQVNGEIDRLQGELAGAIDGASQYFAKGASETVRGGAGATEMARIVTQGVGAVSNVATANAIKANLLNTGKTMTGPGAAAFNQIVSVGFGR